VKVVRAGWWVLKICLLVAAVMMLLAMYGVFEHRDPQLVARNTVGEIHNALTFYFKDFGTVPVGDDRTIFRALHGENPQSFVFLKRKSKKDEDADGRLLDPWGSPYRIDLSDPANPKVWSPGKNKKDEPDDPHSDDICSWR
jgi:hypothetical protein